MKSIFRWVCGSALLVTSIAAQATEFVAPRAGASLEQNLEIQKYHRNLMESGVGLSGGTPSGIYSATQSVYRPYAEYEQAGYLIYSSGFHFGSRAIKQAIASNLPDGVTLVVFAQPHTVEQTRKTFSEWIAPERLKVIALTNADRGFWARDGIPVPMISESENGEEELQVVDARYYHPFEPDETVADVFSLPMRSHAYFYEGGNFVANTKGDCLVVENVRVLEMPDSVFTEQYGCQRLLRLPHLRGIGHADEAVKFISDTEVLTDTVEYVEDLTKMGFKVTLLPRPRNSMENYVNSLIINGTAFIPVFDQSTDAAVIQIYESKGLKVVPLYSGMLSNQGMGSIHCITMAYPAVEFQELERRLETFWDHYVGGAGLPPLSVPIPMGY